MILLRAVAVWLLIILIESIHGIFRTLLLAPWMGDFPARQFGVFTGSLLILTAAYLSIRWLRAETTGALIAVGFTWLVLTVLFEVGLGRFVLHLSWERIVSDYDIRHGRLMLFGLLILTLSPLIAAKMRGLDTGGGKRML
jgi:hypothetical protein